MQQHPVLRQRCSHPAPVECAQRSGTTHLIMRPSSLGGGRILRRTLSVRLSVRPSRYH